MSLKSISLETSSGSLLGYDFAKKNFLESRGLTVLRKGKFNPENFDLPEGFKGLILDLPGEITVSLRDDRENAALVYLNLPPVESVYRGKSELSFPHKRLYSGSARDLPEVYRAELPPKISALFA